MFLNLLATVRSTETWTPGDLIALAVVALVVAVVVRIRVRRRR
jgi:MYXO-CTERM domain-containing protein